MTNFPRPKGFPETLADLERRLYALERASVTSDIDPTALAPAANWTSGILYSRRSGLVILQLSTSRTSGSGGSGEAISDALPVGFRPLSQVIAQAQSGGTLQGCYMNTDGILRVDFGGVGYFGTFSFPV